MENTFIDIRLEGDNFSPIKLKSLTNLPIEVIAEKGEIAKKGRYKGKPYPFGMALIKVDGKSKDDFNNILGGYLAILLKDKKKALKQSGVEDIVVDVETPSHQDSRFSFEKKLIKEISNLNARIEFQTSEEQNVPMDLMEGIYKSLRNVDYNNLISKKEFNEIQEALTKQLTISNPEFKSAETRKFAILGFCVVFIFNFFSEDISNISLFESFKKKITS